MCLNDHLGSVQFLKPFPRSNGLLIFLLDMQKDLAGRVKTDESFWTLGEPSKPFVLPLIGPGHRLDRY